MVPLQKKLSRFRIQKKSHIPFSKDTAIGDFDLGQFSALGQKRKYLAPHNDDRTL